MEENRILVILDGSPRAEGAIPAALLRARSTGAEIRLLHVLPAALPLIPSNRERERAAWLYLITAIIGLLRH